MEARMRKFILSGVSAVLMAGCSQLQTMEGQDMAQAQVPVQRPVAYQPPPPPIVNYRYVTLSGLTLNNLGNEIIIKPGETIRASVNYAYHCQSCKPDSASQIIIGLAFRSAQACIYDGGTNAQGTATFGLKV